MKKEMFNELMQGIREMKAIRAGTMKPTRVTKLTPDHPRAVRAQLGLTQSDFATMIGVPVGTLRNWEQGIRVPTGPAKALLLVAARFPTQTARALSEGLFAPRLGRFHVKIKSMPVGRAPVSVGRATLSQRMANSIVQAASFSTGRLAAAKRKTVLA